MNPQPFRSFQTERCIITGEPPTVWCGHVFLKDMWLGRMCPEPKKTHDVSVLCGFKDNETYKKAASLSDAYGCYGEWKQEYGIVVVEEH